MENVDFFRRRRGQAVLSLVPLVIYSIPVYVFVLVFARGETSWQDTILSCLFAVGACLAIGLTVYVAKRLQQNTVRADFGWWRLSLMHGQIFLGFFCFLFAASSLAELLRPSVHRGEHPQPIVSLVFDVAWIIIVSSVTWSTWHGVPAALNAPKPVD